jgi:HK97 family phage prohead protease
MGKKTFVLVSSEKVNSHGFRVDLRGMDLDRFKANPVMLFRHNRDDVIGRWENIRIEGNTLLADADFDINDPKAKEIAGKVERGYIKGCSISIYINKVADEDKGMLITSSELMEASIVAVPADSNAILLYDKEGKNIVNFDAIKTEINNSLNKQIMEKKETELTAHVADLTAKLAERDKRIGALETQVQTLEKARVETLIDKAIAAKKIGADEKQTYVDLAQKDFAAVEKIIEKMRGVERVASQLSATSQQTATTTATWDELDKAGKLAQLKADDPETFKRLYKVKFGVEPKLS